MFSSLSHSVLVSKVDMVVLAGDPRRVTQVRMCLDDISTLVCAELVECIASCGPERWFAVLSANDEDMLVSSIPYSIL